MVRYLNFYLVLYDIWRDQVQVIKFNLKFQFIAFKTDCIPSEVDLIFWILFQDAEYERAAINMWNVHSFSV